ncbi:MAG: dTDP-4-dehydrorhamnose [Rhodospirillaceae bacterium]|nr:MAG: dTDP-4-dehydrorhamnose [Rhodospirillaceae bacterium]TNC97447.1 MAG: dTDP-4-dehydrorhamnose reductase [Stygiobacter sp.]
MSPDKILILGASGFIGRALAQRLGERAVATWNSRAVPGWHHFDATRNGIDTLPLNGVSHAIILLGNTNPDSCARDRHASDRLNIECVLQACDALGQRGIHCTFASTEVVFDGKAGGYVETDPTAAMLVYGQQKVAVEQHLTAHWPQAAIFRLAKVYGTSPGDGSLLDGWYRQAQAGGAIRCAADFISSVVHVDDVVDAFLGACQRNLSGLYHLGGPAPVSRLAMFQALLEAFAKAGTPLPAQAVGCSIDDFPTLEGRPKDVSLNNTKLVTDLSWSPRSIGQACADFVTLARGIGG